MGYGATFGILGGHGPLAPPPKSAYGNCGSGRRISFNVAASACRCPLYRTIFLLYSVTDHTSVHAFYIEFWFGKFLWLLR